MKANNSVRNHRGSNKERGAVLLWVIWLLLAVSLLTLLIMGRSQNLSGLATAEIQNAERRHLLEGAIHQAFARYLNDGQQQHIARQYQIAMDQMPVTVEVTSEAGRINLNRADQDTLSALFASFDVDPQLADRLAASIIDWRDSDELATGNGAETLDYLRRGQSAKPRNGDFQTVGEIAHILDMPQDKLPCFMPLLTVYSPAREVDPSEATPAVRRVFDWADQHQWKGRKWELIKTNSSVLNSSNNQAAQAIRFEAHFNPSLGVTQTLSIIVRPIGLQRNPIEILAFRDGSGAGPEIRIDNCSTR